MPCDNHPDHQRRPQRRCFYKEAPVQDQLMNIHAVKARVSMGKTKIYSLIKGKNFPRPYHHPSLGKFPHWLASATRHLSALLPVGPNGKTMTSTVRHN
ncbi:helix-turn-helix transcriptional regulator [Pseudogulbenkiania sp. NH8B]|uniref:helix-turn-helix transcriptional regulator n=1 Tax=Pseudogulbenkiania sp. (strain NH8B) TaxID=748280 RepID=UPI0009FE5C6B